MEPSLEETDYQIKIVFLREPRRKSKNKGGALGQPLLKVKPPLNMLLPPHDRGEMFCPLNL
jgi:hypothetical protein